MKRTQKIKKIKIVKKSESKKIVAAQAKQSYGVWSPDIMIKSITNNL